MDGESRRRHLRLTRQVTSTKGYAVNSQFVVYVGEETAAYGPFPNEAEAQAWADEYTSDSDDSDDGESDIVVAMLISPDTKVVP